MRGGQDRGDRCVRGDGVLDRQSKERKSAMARDKVRVWYDREGDYLEVMFDLETPGYFRDTQDDRVMEKVDAVGNVLGFSILRVSALRETPLEVSL